MNLQKSLLICVFASVCSTSSFAQANPAQPSGQAGQPQNTPAGKGPEATTPSAQSQESDPLSFYRKNPELMRRYFPHLYQSAGAQSPTGGGMSGTTQPEQVRGSFSFPGGSAQELVATLKKNFDPAPNVIIPPNLKETPVPEFELQNVTLADMFQALNSLSEDKSVRWQLSGSTEPIWVLNPVEDSNASSGPQAGFAGGGYGMAGMMAAVDPRTGLPINPGPTCQILPVAKYLKHYKIEDITTAVKTAWSMMGNDAAAKMKYHTDTKLLIVVGTPEQLSVLTQVLSSLEANPESEAPPAGLPDSGKNKATKTF